MNFRTKLVSILAIFSFLLFLPQKPSVMAEEFGAQRITVGGYLYIQTEQGVQPAAYVRIDLKNPEGIILTSMYTRLDGSYYLFHDEVNTFYVLQPKKLRNIAFTPQKVTLTPGEYSNYNFFSSTARAIR